jgi:hypothetical protein
MHTTAILPQSFAGCDGVCLAWRIGHDGVNPDARQFLASSCVIFPLQ